MKLIEAKYKLNATHVPHHVYEASKNNINYTAYTMLVAIANYSENKLSKSRAEWILEDNDEKDIKQCVTGADGSFMMAVYDADFIRAYRLADESNREALGIAIYKKEIEL